MKRSYLFTYILPLLLTAFVFPSALQAEDLIDQSSNVFNFQQKLAKSGNVHAQYKLATMYEKGDGVKADIEQAKYWYNLASNAGSTSAKQRNTYLIVKEQGYDQAKHADWLNSIEKDASAHNADAVLLLGQLYHQGLGVKKDLDKSLELLNQVRVLGAANVENEIASIRQEIAANKKAAQLKQEKRELEKAQSQQAKKQLKIEQQNAREIESQANKQKQAEAAILSKAEKRKKYEEVMRQLKLEQQQIDEQQSLVTGDTETTVDDEI
jgi:TPR repeat protein